MWVGCIFSFELSSIKLHLGEVDTMQCLLSLYDLQEGYHDRPGGGQDHQDVLKIKHAMPNASLISQC